MEFLINEQEVKTCGAIFKDKIRHFMIPPDNKKLRYFHILLSLVFYLDIFYTSYIYGNPYFHDEGHVNYLYHE